MVQLFCSRHEAKQELLTYRYQAGVYLLFSRGFFTPSYEKNFRQSKKQHFGTRKKSNTVSTGIVMRVIPDTELWGKDVLTMLPPATKFFWDHGPRNYLCGKCKIMLAEAVCKMEGTNKVLKCNNCGSYNAFANK